ncbi:MAG TPA: biotin/lipoyl-containing protein [Steroidobacteraceae bacterium]|nr:biotin/lipoyl-containing protein [Steroidobacteraceae bacterium]
MSLTSKDVAEITRILEESSFDELYLEINGFKLTLKRSGAASSNAPLTSAVQPAVPAAARSHGPSAPSSPQPPSDVCDVTAPLLGTFYRAPKPGEAPFVELGSRVEEGTIVGIIEVMKLMNTVRAGTRGKVVEILGRDGTLVEYGEVLLRVSPSA